MENKRNLKFGNANFFLYTTPQGNVKVEVFFQDETVWLTQQLLAELFATTKQNISLHLKNAFQEGEISEISVVKEFLTTAADGKQYKVKYYNLDAIISVLKNLKALENKNSKKK